MSEGWLDEVRRLIELARGAGVLELELVRPDLRVRFRRQPQSREAAPATPAAETEASRLQEPLHAVLAPFTGTFYRRPDRSSPPYVEPGDWVDVGQTICLVETMKVFNPVVADVAGVVIELPVADGQLVHEGEPLAFIRPGPRPDAPLHAAG